MALVLVIVLLLPMIALITQGTSRDALRVLLLPATLQALWLSLSTSTIALVVVVLFGTPLSYLLSRSKAPLIESIQTLVQLPVVLPPAVAGVALLSAFGQQGFLGPVLDILGLRVVFSTGAIVLTAVFVAGPLYVQGAINAFSSIDEELFWVARSMGARSLRIFWKVALPLARPALISAGLLCGARALGEFGATLMFAGNLPGRTQTMPLLIYTAMENDFAQARTLSLVLLLLSALLLTLSLGLSRRWWAQR
jgi:molybdate transport system permease protein